jgi:hypothetical protein
MKVPACALLMLGVATSAQGSDSLMLTGSTESSIGSYTYLGALMPLPHSVLGQGWVVRQWLYRLTYRYDGSAPDIHAEAFGYAPAIGYQWPMGYGDNHAGLYAGVRLAHTHLSPADPHNNDDGTRARFSLQGELTSRFGVVAQNQLLAQGEFGNGAYYVRERLAWRLFGHYTFGPEATAQGSREYRAWEAGLCLGGITLTPHTGLLVRAGIKEQAGRPTAGEVGLELSASF